MGTVAIPETTKGENLKVEIRRVIRASRQRIFEAWTRPEEIMKWFGPVGTVVLDAHADVREGGTWHIMTSPCEPPAGGPPASKSGASGEYVRVIPDRLLSYTWRPDWSPGEETLVTLELEEVAGGTEVRLRHERFVTEDSRNRHNFGWTGALEKLAAYIEG